MELRGARALVTGGSSGIGLATARLLAGRSRSVFVTGSDPDRVRRAAAGLPRSGRLPQDAPYRVAGQSTAELEQGLVCDFADPAAVAGLAAALSAAPAFDVVVHSAGIGLRTPATNLAAPELDRLFAVNVHAAMALTAAVLPAMLGRRRGRLVFVGSIAGAVGAAGEAAYAASKAAVTAYADSLRVELAGTGVCVTVLVPGVVDTGFFARRGVPYHRTRPRPVPARLVADKLVGALARDRDLVVVPGWLRIPMALKAVAPQRYGRLAARWGR